MNKAERNTRIIVLSPHPDDETLGAGGMLLRYKVEGAQTFWLNITDMYEEAGFTVDKINQRKSEINNVINAYQFDDFFNLKLPSTGLDKLSKNSIIQKISSILNRVKPNIVILPYKHDVHSDHRIVFDCGFSSSKVFRFSSIKKILAMEVVSETDYTYYENGFCPNYFVNITGTIEKKLEIMKIYKDEYFDHPFPRSLETLKALAKFRGSQAGFDYAESFIIIKEVE